MLLHLFCHEPLVRSIRDTAIISMKASTDKVCPIQLISPDDTFELVPVLATISISGAQMQLEKSNVLHTKTPAHALRWSAGRYAKLHFKLAKLCFARNRLLSPGPAYTADPPFREAIYFYGGISERRMKLWVLV